jgi:two-component system chemotaxis response regulator CheB
MGRPIRVLIADDSAMARSLLRSYYEEQVPRFEVIGEARDGGEAVRLAGELRPDLVTMDLNMPVMSGLEAIGAIMRRHPLPILVVSGFADATAAYAALSAGAVEVVGKPCPDDAAEFIAKSRQAAQARVAVPAAPPSPAGLPSASVAPAALPPAPILAIAASTGGPQALARILGALPADFSCPVLIAQHISDGFAAGLVEWLGSVSRLPVRLAAGGEALRPGVVLVSPSEHHMTATPAGIVLRPRAARDLYRPSCDALLGSVADGFGRRAVGVVLTGMGSDGVGGLERIRHAGGHTIAQDEASSVVFGMNRMAIERGAAQRVLSLDAIAAAVRALAPPQRTATP